MWQIKENKPDMWQTGLETMKPQVERTVDQGEVLLDQGIEVQLLNPRETQGVKDST